MKHSEAFFLIFGGIGFAIMWVLGYVLGRIELLDAGVFIGLGLAISACGGIMLVRQNKESQFDN